ncbi:MAG: nitroreductase family deazaflavin-dependent oxidoreductase [Nostocoides sp.]
MRWLHSRGPGVGVRGRLSREDRAMDQESPLSEVGRAALHQSQVIDLTTRGRRSGQGRRIEIFLHSDNGQLFITGIPQAERVRDWIYNIEADSHVVVHLKQSVVADLPARAVVVTDPDQRRPFIEAAAKRWGRTDVPDMLRHSPLILLTIDDDSAVDRIDS